MARKSLLVMVAGAAAVGVIATGAAAAAFTGGSNDRLGVAVSPTPSDDSTPSDDFTTPSDDFTTPSDDSTPSEDSSTPPGDDNSTPPSDDPTSKAPAADAVSRDRAIDIALGKTGGGTVVDTEREWEHGRPAWKIEIVKGGVEYKVYVDRETGGIVKYDRDDDRSGSGSSGHGGDDDRGGKGRGGYDD
ncbi:PepSY domain-containing protein [Phytohabitans flavus]|uniref:PepSY domain-containing protein n=1 Tax=Phytohabitans flavus TaxID=1076124 RepID=UPI003640CFBC